MNQLEAFNVLLDIIKTGKRHPEYKHTCELAEDYEAFSTGEHLDDKLKQYSIGQSDDAFKVQKEITVHIAPSIISNLTHIYFRVPRSQGMKLGWGSEDKTTEADFQETLNNFCRDGFDEYMEQKIKDLIELDPNAWIVIEFKDTDGSTLAQPYPYEVYAENAIMFEYDVARLVYLVDMHEVKLVDRYGVKVECEQYTIYTEVGSVKITQQTEKLPAASDLKQIDLVADIPEAFNIENKGYVVSVPAPYNLKAVPARCVGYIQDKTNNGQSFVNMYHSCMPFLSKMLKANSEMDIAMAKHVHPQKIQYVRACVNEGCHICQDSKYYIDYDEHKLCPVCRGRGFTDVTQGGLEYLYFPFPNSKDEMLDLSNIVHYVQVDIETPQMLAKYVDHMVEMCRKTMFNQDNISSEDVAKTAREIMYNEANKDDTLRPYAVNYAIIYNFMLTTIADITQRQISIVATVSKDFNMRGLAEWTTILQGLVLAGANDAIIASVQAEIMRALHGETEVAKQYALTQVLIPFQSMSKELKALEIAVLPRTDYYRVASIYGNDIIKTLARENPLFWEMSFDKIKELFDVKVQERITQLETPAQEFETFTPESGGGNSVKQETVVNPDTGKEEVQQTYSGERGGRYWINEKGNKIYV